MARKILKCVLGAALLAAIFSGCTRHDPFTGQQQVDVGATAGVAGLALGAAALGVAANNNNNFRRRDVVVVNRGPAFRRRDVVVVNRGPVYRPYRGGVHRGGGQRGGIHRGGIHRGGVGRRR